METILRRLLVPSRETAGSAYGLELARQVAVGMRVLGVVFTIYSVAMLLSLALAAVFHVQVFGPDLHAHRLRFLALDIVVGVFLFVSARRLPTADRGRTYVSAAMLVIAVVLGWSELQVSGARESGMFILMLLVIAAVPFRPLQALSMCLATTGVFALVTLLAPTPETDVFRQLRLVNLIPPLMILSLSSTVMSALIYAGRARLAHAHVDSEELRDRLRVIAEVAETSPVPTMRFDREGVLLWANPAAEHYPKRVGKPDLSIRDFLPEDHRARLKSDATGTQLGLSHDTQGRSLMAAYKHSPNEGEVIVTLTDLTAETGARRRAEEYARELEQTQVQLVQSEKMASLGQLVAGIAHEINTPLGAMNSNIDTVQRSVHKATQLVTEQPELEKILRGAERLNDVNRQAVDRINRIVNGMRHFARLDQSEVDTVDVRRGIEDTLTLVEHELKGKHIEVIKELDEIPMIECYPNQLNQVFMNLIVNAIQAIQSEGEITIRTRPRGAKVEVEVHDTGVGIPAEDLSRIFDPGFTTKGVGVGTGLGLSIVHQIIDAHGAQIDVDSEVGKGTSVRVLLSPQLSERSRVKPALTNPNQTKPKQTSNGSDGAPS